MNSEFGTVEQIPETDEMIRQKIESELRELGVLEPPEEIVDKLSLIEKHSKFNQDSRMIREGFGNVIDYIDRKYHTDAKLSEEQKNEGVLSAYIHDIGKASSSADTASQLSVIRLFAAENVKDPNQTISETLRLCFPDEYDQMLSDLVAVSITGETTMRDFWDRHAFWTKEILDRRPDIFNERVRVIAPSHHFDRGINPCNIKADMVPNESKVIGSLEYYVEVLEERALMAVDQYQAAIFRGKTGHEKAMEYVRGALKSYGDDDMINFIICAIDDLGRQSLLFPKTAGMKLSERK